MSDKFSLFMVCPQFRAGARFRTQDLKRWIKAGERVYARALLHVEDVMQRRAATEYMHLLIQNIMTRKYASGYPPYHPRYAAWKEKRTNTGYFWFLRGDLLRNIQIFPFKSGRRKNWMAGVPSGVMDAGHKSWFGGGKSKPIAMYGRIMEEGKPPGPGGRHPKRSVFEPTMNEYAEEGWLIRGQEALDQISLGWK